ncbi:UNVERIFIED_ORG: hypothetical protein ABIB52_003507 [Arthrobacter sp. UYCu721]
MRIIMRIDFPLGDCGCLCAHTVTRGDVADSGAKPCPLTWERHGNPALFILRLDEHPMRACGDVASK